MPMRQMAVAWIVAMVWIGMSAGLGADLEADPAELPRIPPTEPAQALATFDVEPGFQLDLVAHEPALTDPIAIAFDENGAIFAVEMRSYSERREDALCRIQKLTDPDGDGVYDQSTTYAEGLKWATAVACWKGGVFVAASPDIFYFRDDDGDGVADTKQVIYTGFGKDDPAGLNVQALLNSFQWGMDNRLYGSTAPNGGEVSRADAPSGKPVPLRGADFSFDPASLDLRAESGTAQYGLSFDTHGRRYLSSNSNHLIAVMYDTWRAGSGLLPLPAPLSSIAADGPAAEVFRSSPDEPWRIVRTRWRASGAVAGAVEGGGRVSGYFTAATGVTIYTGDAFGPDWVDNAFIGDAGSNLVHRKVIHQAANGVTLSARRAPDGEGREFLRSRDNWFRPTTFANAPDGCLYIVDMYRETIEHPSSLPPGIKKHLDLNSGNDRGRLYRMRPQGAALRPAPRLGDAGTAELVALLAHANGWHRITAQRLLFERQDAAAVAPLRALLKDSPSALGRLHALHALEGQKSLGDGDLAAALGDADAWVRTHAVPLAAARGSVWTDRIAALSRDPAPEVRYATAQALGSATGEHKVQALADLATQAGEDAWLQGAVLNALRTGGEAGALFEGLSLGHVPEGFVLKLVEAIGRSRSPEAAAPVLESIVSPTLPPGEAQRRLRALGDGLAATGKGDLSGIDPGDKLKPLFTKALATAQDAAQPETERLAAIHLMRHAASKDAGAVALRIFGDAPTTDLQLASLEVAQARQAPALAESVLARWPQLSPRVRAAAIAALTARSDSARVLLAAVKAASVSPAEIPSTTQAALLKHSDADVKALAQEIYAGARASRQEVVNRYLDSEKLQGDAARGQAKFDQVCIACHRSGDKGFPVGPDRVTFKAKGRTVILTNVLDPNREVAPQYLAYSLTTKSGETLTGTIAAESPSTVTLLLPFGAERPFPRESIASLQALGQSLMPEGLEHQLTPQDMADLVEYIVTAP